MEVASEMISHSVECPMCWRYVVVPAEMDALAQEWPLDIKTPRLSMLCARVRDWKELIEICSHLPNYRYEISGPRSSSELRKSLKEAVYPKGFRKSKTLIFLVRKSAGRQVIGEVTVQFDPSLRTASLGVMIHESFQRRGFGRESVGGVVDVLFEAMNLRKISSACDAKNTACVKLFESLGFTGEGYLRDWLYHPERGWVDARLFACFHPAVTAEREAQGEPGG